MDGSVGGVLESKARPRLCLGWAVQFISTHLLVRGSDYPHINLANARLALFVFCP